LLHLSRIRCLRLLDVGHAASHQVIHDPRQFVRRCRAGVLPERGLSADMADSTMGGKEKRKRGPVLESAQAQPSQRDRPRSCRARQAVVTNEWAENAPKPRQTNGPSSKAQGSRNVTGIGTVHFGLEWSCCLPVPARVGQRDSGRAVYQPLHLTGGTRRFFVRCSHLSGW
jgi:hypothetical protein